MFDIKYQHLYLIHYLNNHLIKILQKFILQIKLLKIQIVKFKIFLKIIQ